MREHGAAPLWRRVLLCVALLAFTLQSYVAQTHVHRVAPAHEVSFSAPSDSGGKGQDPADCPICTHIQLAGHFLLPGDVAAVAPFVAVQLVALTIAPATFHVTVSHIWRGRGPPRL